VIINSVVALVMLILGLNLLDTFPSLRKFEFHLPKFFGRLTLKESHSAGLIAPVLVGAATFFLPCGFTQSMQIYSLTTGSFLVGGLTMLSFALGTLPVLALLSFTSFEISQKPWKGIFFKTAGLIVMALALINLWSGLTLLGLV
jgi:sulfite exporter TauE/SafE